MSFCTIYDLRLPHIFCMEHWPYRLTANLTGKTTRDNFHWGCPGGAHLKHLGNPITLNFGWFLVLVNVEMKYLATIPIEIFYSNPMTFQ